MKTPERLRLLAADGAKLGPSLPMLATSTLQPHKPKISLPVPTG